VSDSNILWKKIQESRRVLEENISGSFPKVVVVLGSGLSGLLEDIDIENELPYEEIPHIQPLTVQGHRGRLTLGKLNGVSVACMQGRLHYYEGYDMSEVVFPFRLFAQAGAETFILTNAAGGVHAEMSPGDLVLLTDHINMMGNNPLIGSNIEQLGPRFPDMTRVYDPQLREIFKAKAKELGLKLREGVYLAIHGPSYETPSEINMYRTLGADVVGMSTVPEAIALFHMKRKIVGISCVTNLAAGVTSVPLDHKEVLENAKQAHAPFRKLVGQVIQEIG